MPRLALDAIDLKILRILRDNGRITNVALAERVGISPPPCLRRVRALEQAGYVHGYHAELDPDLIGYEVTAFCHVGLVSQAEADLKSYEELVRSWPNVRECHMLMGEDDFILKVMAPSVEELNAFIISHLTSAPNVKNVKTAICIRRSDRKPSVPVPTA